MFINPKKMLFFPNISHNFPIVKPVKRRTNCGYLRQVTLNPIALRKAKIACNFGLSECNRVSAGLFALYFGSRDLEKVVS